MNVGQDTTLGDCDVAQKLVQLLIVADGELEMTGNNTGLLVVAGSVTGQFENFSCEVFEDGSQVDWGTGTDTLSVVALSEETVNTADWESETSLGGATVSKEVSQTVQVRVVLITFQGSI
jgi:citrate lyase alpha subunit